VRKTNRSWRHEYSVARCSLRFRVVSSTCSSVMLYLSPLPFRPTTNDANDGGRPCRQWRSTLVDTSESISELPTDEDEFESEVAA
jgi:hypothetical protein